jgi:hypothetical protein
MVWHWVAVLLVSGLFQTAPQDPPDDGVLRPATLERVVDERAVARCRGAIVGFSNVPLECTADETGSLRQCELLTDNRAAHRLKPRFDCMAAAVSVFDESGAPAAGATVRITFDGPYIFSED